MPLEYPQKYDYLTLHINKFELSNAPSILAPFAASLQATKIS
jgi:hypothetical protein